MTTPPPRPPVTTPRRPRLRASTGSLRPARPRPAQEKHRSGVTWPQALAAVAAAGTVFGSIWVGKTASDVADQTRQDTLVSQRAQQFTTATGQLAATSVEVQMGGAASLGQLLESDASYTTRACPVLRAYTDTRLPTNPPKGEKSPDPPTRAALATLDILGGPCAGQPGLIFGNRYLGNAPLPAARLNGLILTRANLTGANLRGAKLREAYLTGADLTGANLTEADLGRADLTEAVLGGADLFGADLFGADLRWADLSGANLTRANLTSANLSGANLTRADLSGANLSGANLRGADLTEIRHDEKTRWPEGFTPPPSDERT